MTADNQQEPSLNSDHPQSEKSDILDIVGGDGPWQRRIFLFALCISIPAASHNLSMTFLAPNIDFWCARPPSLQNLSLEQWRTVGLPHDDQRCSRYEYINLTHYVDENVTSSFKTIPCDAWEYNTTYYSSTVVNEWNLVCDKEWLISMSKSIYMFGILTEVILFGYISDRIGRRPAMTVSSLIGVFAAFTCTFSTSFNMFAISRFFTAVGLSGCFGVAFVLLMEVVGPELRPTYGLAVQFGWCLGFVSLPGIAWLIRDWFYIQMALTVPCIIFLATWWIVPESPRWMLAHGKVQEAQTILSQAADINKATISDIDVIMKKIVAKAREVHESGECSGNIFTLLRTPGLWQIAVNMYFVWFVTSFVYYGLSYNTNELAGDPFINFAVSGAVEFPAYFLSIFAIRSLGRRNPLAGSMIIGGLTCLLSNLLPREPWWLSVAVAMIGKFCITGSFGIIYVYTTELFPTVVRNIGLGSASLFARFGSIVAPFVRELGNATHPVMPYMIFGILATLSGVLVLLLPETNNRRIPDTFKEAADASRKIIQDPKLNEDHFDVAFHIDHADIRQREVNENAPAVSPL